MELFYGFFKLRWNYEDVEKRVVLYFILCLYTVGFETNQEKIERKLGLIYGLINFDTDMFFYVKYKEQLERALRVFPLCFPHEVINYFMSLKNVNQTTKYTVATVILDSHY